MPTDALTLVFMALSAVTSGLLFLFRQLMVEKDKSFARLEKDCNETAQRILDDNKWLKGQLEDLQKTQVAQISLMSKAVDQQGVGVNTVGAGVKSILELLQASVNKHDFRSER